MIGAKRFLLPLGIGVSAALAIFLLTATAEGADPSNASASSARLILGTSPSAETFDAVHVAPVRPCVTDDAGPAAARGPESRRDPRTRPQADRDLLLIDAQVLEKYLAFRESLTTP